MFIKKCFFFTTIHYNPSPVWWRETYPHKRPRLQVSLRNLCVFFNSRRREAMFLGPSKMTYVYNGIRVKWSRIKWYTRSPMFLWMYTAGHWLTRSHDPAYERESTVQNKNKNRKVSRYPKNIIFWKGDFKMCKFIHTAIRLKLLPVKLSRSDPSKYTYDLLNWKYLIQVIPKLAAFGYFVYFNLPGMWITLYVGFKRV